MTNRAGLSTSSADAPPTGKLVVRVRQLSSLSTLAPLLVFVVMLLAVCIPNPAYLRPIGISIVTASAAPIMLVALGQSMVLNVGSVDLSNAAISLLGAILLALGAGALIAVLLLMTIIGAINGAIVAYTQVPSFALTLGTLGILETAALVTSGGNTIYVTRNRELVRMFYDHRFLHVPMTFWVGILVAIIYWLVLRFTIVGQNMTAVGKNESGAILSAVPVQRMKIAAFAISGFTGGLAGVSIVAQAGSASASGLGSDLLLPGIAAALVGGTSISGGLTNPINVVLGALTVAFVPIAIQAFGFSAQAQSLVYGLFIIAVVTLTTARSRESIIK